MTRPSESQAQALRIMEENYSIAGTTGSNGLIESESILEVETQNFSKQGKIVHYYSFGKIP